MTPRPIAGALAPPAHDYDADIVILSLDRTRETLEAIGSALAQTDVSRHIWVIDQGSRLDGLATLARAVAGRPDASLVALGRNLGVAGGRNVGVALGHGEVIAALDNDAEFAEPDTLAAIVAGLRHDPGLAAIGLRILVHATGRDDLSSWGYPSALLPRAGGCFDAATFVGAGHAIRRAAWDDAAWDESGGYDPALFFTWEEYDFCLRAIDRGWRVRYRGDLCVRHKVSPERRVDWSGARWFQQVRNRLYIERKWAADWTALAPRAAAYLARGARHGMSAETLRAIAAGLRMPVAAPSRMGADGLRYLARHDAAHRGGWADRLRREVLAPLSS